MGNDAGHWPRACNGRRLAARLPCCRRDDNNDFVAFEDPSGVLAGVVLDMLHQLKAINYHLGEVIRMSDSIQTQAQSPEEKQRRHATNVRQLQQNMTEQIRDLNAGLETLQNQHPTLAMGGLFNSVHALDSNQRALLDLAKEAAGLAAFEIPPAPRLIDHTSSNDPNKAPADQVPPMYSNITIDQTDQPSNVNPAMSGMVREPSPDITSATDATQAQENKIVPGKA